MWVTGSSKECFLDICNDLCHGSASSFTQLSGVSPRAIIIHMSEGSIQVWLTGILSLSFDRTETCYGRKHFIVYCLLVLLIVYFKSAALTHKSMSPSEIECLSKLQCIDHTNQIKKSTRCVSSGTWPLGALMILWDERVTRRTPLSLLSFNHPPPPLLHSSSPPLPHSSPSPHLVSISSDICSLMQVLVICANGEPLSAPGLIRTTHLRQGLFLQPSR